MLGLVNAVVRPVLVLLTLPVTILTLGLFIFVLNGLLFWMVGTWLEGFEVGGFWPAVFGAIVFSLVSWLLSALVLREASPPIADPIIILPYLSYGTRASSPLRGRCSRTKASARARDADGRWRNLIQF